MRLHSFLLQQDALRVSDMLGMRRSNLFSLTTSVVRTVGRSAQVVL